MEQNYADPMELRKGEDGIFDGLKAHGVTMGKKIGIIATIDGETILAVGKYAGPYGEKTYEPDEHPEGLLSEGLRIGFLEATIMKVGDEKHQVEPKLWITLNDARAETVRFYPDPIIFNGDVARLILEKNLPPEKYQHFLHSILSYTETGWR